MELSFVQLGHVKFDSCPLPCSQIPGPSRHDSWLISDTFPQHAEITIHLASVLKPVVEICVEILTCNHNEPSVRHETTKSPDLQIFTELRTGSEALRRQGYIWYRKKGHLKKNPFGFEPAAEW